MRTNASIELAMQLSTQEAASGRFGKIEPEHILAAILKFSELPVEEVDRMAPGSDAAEQLAAEVRVIRQELASRSIDSKQARRRLRAELGRGDARHVHPPLHRSKASRKVFDTASRLAEGAGSDTLKAEHLLEALLMSPTPVVEKVFGDALRTKTWKPRETPLLDQCGQDLTRMAANGELPEVSGRRAECKVLIQALSQGNRRGVLLVSDNDGDTGLVVMAAARTIAGPDVPTGLKRSRILDVTGLEPSRTGDAEALDRLGSILAEAARAPQVILWVPALETPGDDQAGGQWAGLLRATLTEGPVRCICRVSPEVYARAVKKSAVWKRLAQVIWLHERSDSEIPREL